MRSARRAGRRAPSTCRGQATVELALGLPVVCLAVLLVLQLALVGRDVVLVTHAAREAAREAATDPAQGAALAGARAAGGLDPARLEARTARQAGRVTVRIRYSSSTELPIVGRLVPDPTLTVAATMHDETTR